MKRKVGKRNFGYRGRYTEFLTTARTRFAKKTKETSVIGLIRLYILIKGRLSALFDFPLLKRNAGRKLGYWFCSFLFSLAFRGDMQAVRSTLAGFAEKGGYASGAEHPCRLRREKEAGIFARK